jgi:hypothetical protein
MANAVVAGGATPAVQAETPVQAAPAAENRSLQPNPSEQDFQEKARSATSPGAVRDLIKQAMTKAPPKSPEAAPPPSEGQPAAEVATETPPAAEGETPAATETPAEGGETPAATPDDDDADDGPVVPSDAKKLRLRLPDTDTVGRLAASFMKRNRDLSMEDAVAKAKNQLGVKPDAAKPSTESEAPPASELPATIGAVDEAIKALRLERRKALSDVRMEDAADASDKIEDLQRRRFELERHGEREESRAAQSYNAKFAESEAKATDLYPDAAKADSEFGKRMAEIDAEFAELKDPLYSDPEKPLRIAQMVAREMNIAPRRKGTPVAPAKPAAAPATTAPQIKKGVVPSGSSRTAAPLTNQPPAIDGQIKAATTVGGLKALYKTMGLRM